MAKLLKWWHQYSMFITIAGYIFLAGMTYKGNNDAIAQIQETQKKVDNQNLDHRVTILEQIASDNHDTIEEIRDTEKAIFQRINQMSDRK